MFEYPVTESRMKTGNIIRKLQGYKNRKVFQNRDCQGADRKKKEKEKKEKKEKANHEGTKTQR